MTFAVPHLSDEAVAAFADGMLGSGARARAARHVSECPECAHAVAVQREAVWALRAAPAPSLPTGLLDRLSALPSTTTLRPNPVQLAPDGSAVFPAFGVDRSMHRKRSIVPTSVVGRRRGQHIALITAGTAIAAMGMAASTASGSVAGAGHRGPTPPSSVTVHQVVYQVPATPGPGH